MTERFELSLAGAAEKLRSAAIVAEEFHIPAPDTGIELYVRNKHPAGLQRFAPEKILLYVHGTSQAASATFDLRLDGLSWMDYLALNGYDVYLVDLRGYGRSTRPPEMRAPAADNPPVVTTDVALRDFGAAVDFVLKRRGVPRIAVMGWSWGTSIVATYTARHNAKVGRLVLYAPVWLRDKPTSASLAAIGAYQTWTVEAQRANLQTGAPDEARAGLMPESWFALWKEAALATDPEGARQNPPVVRSPNGAPKDSRDYWSAGKPYYDPGEIAVPTLIVHGEWDGLLPATMAQAIYAKLTRAPKKRFVQIGGGTHMLMLERNRAQLFQEVQLFLDEPAA
jgi:pimeloyl-ACP methyl ester carboxylesterase